MTAPRDWDKELAEIDRLMAAAPGGAEGGSAAVPAAPRAPLSRATLAGPTARGARLGVWLRVLLVAAAGIGMTQWPVAAECGAPLFLYLAATLVVTLGGVWAATGAWHHRRAVAHVIALAVVGWGLTLAAAVLLPRVGYAREAATWFCH